MIFVKLLWVKVSWRTPMRTKHTRAIEILTTFHYLSMGKLTRYKIGTVLNAKNGHSVPRVLIGYAKWWRCISFCLLQGSKALNFGILGTAHNRNQIFWCVYLLMGSQRWADGQRGVKTISAWTDASRTHAPRNGFQLFAVVLKGGIGSLRLASVYVVVDKGVLWQLFLPVSWTRKFLLIALLHLCSKPQQLEK